MTYALVLLFTLMGGLEAPTVALDLTKIECFTMRAALAHVGIPAACVQRQGV